MDRQKARILSSIGTVLHGYRRCDMSKKDILTGMVIEDQEGGGGASSWRELTGKPFNTIGNGLEVVEGELQTTGGGSGKQNAYASITKIHDYAHQAIYTDIDYKKAYAFFERMKPATNVMADDYKPTSKLESPIGSCDAFYFMGMVARFYDWNFNNQESIVVKTPAMNGRYSVIGTGYNAELTKEVVESGEYHENFDYLPFELVDGINQHGLFISMLVVPNDKGITTGTTPSGSVEAEISTLMLPRYMLDNAFDVSDVMRQLERHVSVYNVMPLIQMGYEIHYYVADAYGMHGVIEFVGNEPVFTRTEIATNFYIDGVVFNDDGTVYTPETQDSEHDAVHTNQITEYGSGLERYNLILNSLKTISEETDLLTLLNNLMYTNAYKKATSPYWYTEFVGGDYKANTPAATYDEPGGIVERAIAEFGRRSRDTGTTWQTVHGGLYDVQNRRMYLAFQEDMTETFEFGFDYYTADEIDSMIHDIGEGNVKFNQYQELSTQEFNQVMQNLKLGARIDEYFDVVNVLERLNEDIAPIDLTYTIPKVSIKPFSGSKEYEVILSFNELGSINVHGYYKSDTLLALEGEFDGMYFENLEYNGSDIVISFKTDRSDLPNLTDITLNELTQHRSVTPIDSELIPQDSSKQDREDYGLATVDKTIVGAVNEVNERVDNISPTGRFLSYWNAATGMPETNPSTIPFEYQSGDWFSISVVASEGNDNYAPTPNEYDGTPSTVQEKNAIEKGDVYRYDGTSWSWEHTATRDVQFRDILGSPFDNTALNNAFALKEDILNKSNVVNNSTDEYLSGAAMLQYIVAGNNGLAQSISDADTARATGFYTCYQATHLPSVSNWGALFVIQGSNKGASRETIQIFIPYQRRYSIWYRTWDNSTDWSDWKEIALAGNSVNKTTEAYKLYGTDASGNPTTYTVAWYLDSNIIPMRDNGGALRVGTPTMDTHAISRAYAEEHFQGILTEVAGYNPNASQVLKNINGTLQWVDEV